ncbi:cytochrome P450 [Arthrobacter russicus]|uniref:Cytochrome P450 n=1 Tax=Arthrobacter russicus TaxID=172040 RepID=A0ABU1JF03_9MICC|nr:cytochrome P450 [Arthrobacter russicus]MDR6271024.1 cytochrome P450 [Arthrobacter russicus]
MSRYATLPPGPAWPAVLQGMLYFVARPELMRYGRKHYGTVFTVRLPRRPTVMIADVEAIRSLFNGPANVFHAGQGNREVLKPVVGQHSMLLLDEDPHLRHRKLLMPAFAGASLRGYRELIAEITAQQTAGWAEGRVKLVKYTQAVTLEIILRVVFGVTDPVRLAKMRKLVVGITDANVVVMAGSLSPFATRYLWPWKTFKRTLDGLDELLYAEIRECRDAPDLAARTDVLARMARAGGQDGDALSDVEIRDELVTLLLAGHETTSNGLAWTLHELMRAPVELARAVAAADRRDKEGDEFLEACFKEGLRLRPVIGSASRLLTQPAEVAGYRLPAGVMVSPSIDLVHEDRTQHVDPGVFRPDRCLDGSVTTSNWLPFGGGVRRCIGAGFSLLEAVEILRSILQTWELRAVQQRVERPKSKHITLVPSKGAMAVLRRRD